MDHVCFVGALAGIAGLAGLTLLFSRSLRNQRGERPLSDQTEVMLKVVSLESEPPRPSGLEAMVAMPIADLFSLYSNSRFRLVEAHQLSLQFPNDELQSWLERFEETHASLLRALVLSVCESVICSLSEKAGRYYSNSVLRLYMDEEWILTEMTQRRLELLEANGVA